MADLSAQTESQAALREGSSSRTVRIATFNVSLYGKKAGEIRGRLRTRDDAQAKRIAGIVQSVRPDILLVNELDYEPDAAPAKLLAENYFAVPQSLPSNDPRKTETLEPISFPHIFSAASNTGIDSELDLNRDGRLGTGNDAWGYGVYPGQYAMAIYSRFPIDVGSVRSFQKLLWKSMPGAQRPIDLITGKPYYDSKVWSDFRLSSKNHLDVPIRVGGKVIHVLASHPTPPVFDGPEDRNGARNHDEIEFWNRYLSGGESVESWLVDDQGRAGGFEANARFVVMGDLNADPDDGSGRRAAIQRLVDHPKILDVRPRCSESDSGGRAAKHRGRGDVRTKTADFGRNGYMRVDYVLPSRDLDVSDSGVFWPVESDPRHRWMTASDHRLVWIDVRLDAATD